MDNLIFTGWALFTFFIIGAVELVKRIYAKDYETAVIIAVAGLIGGLLAPSLLDITFLQGIVAGIGASGAVKLAQSFK